MNYSGTACALMRAQISGYQLTPYRAGSLIEWVESCSEDEHCETRLPFEYPAAGPQILDERIIAKARFQQSRVWNSALA
jgi:hypothetical protein